MLDSQRTRRSSYQDCLIVLYKSRKKARIELYARVLIQELQGRSWTQKEITTDTKRKLRKENDE